MRTLPGAWRKCFGESSRNASETLDSPCPREYLARAEAQHAGSSGAEPQLQNARMRQAWSSCLWICSARGKEVQTRLQVILALGCVRLNSRMASRESARQPTTSKTSKDRSLSSAANTWLEIPYLLLISSRCRLGSIARGSQPFLRNRIQVGQAQRSQALDPRERQAFRHWLSLQTQGAQDFSA